MKKHHVQLTEKDRVHLENFLTNGTLNVRVHKRRLGLQMLDKGLTYQEVQNYLKTSAITTL
jgi:hypothetical protein